MSEKTEESRKAIKSSGNIFMTLPRKQALKPPHNYKDIIKDADFPVDMSSMDKLYDQLLAGVFLDTKKMKYWIDGKSNRNCFMLYATFFSITWAEHIRYWRWISLKENSDDISAAQLVSVSWLQVVGWFNTTKLTPGTEYEVIFVILLKESCYGWGVPVTLKLVLPDGTKQEYKEILVSRPREQWIEIPVGEFKTTPDNVGDMEINLHEYDSGNWKRGLVVKGALIRPKDGA